MKKNYDFSKGENGPVIKVREGKEKIMIRLDTEILNWFRNVAGGGNSQALVNDALRDYMEGRTPKLEDTPLRFIREELKAKGAA